MQNALIKIEEAVVLRGLRAWGKIKTTAAEQRQLWREVGEALNYGRDLHPSNQAFGTWCRVQGFDMDRRVRADAMWFAEQPLSNDWTTTHPTAIRLEHRDAQASKPPSPALDLSAPPDDTLARMAAVAPSADRVKALAAHAAAGGPEGETAARYLAKQAAAKGMTVDEMVKTAEALDPQTPAHLRKAQQEALDYIVKGCAGVLQKNPHLQLTPELVAVAVLNALKELQPC